MKKLRRLLVIGGIALVSMTGIPPASASPATDAYNELSVARNQAGKSTPTNDGSLRSIASDRAKNLASKNGGSPSSGLPSSLTSKGYKESRQLYGSHSSGDASEVVSLLLGDSTSKKIVVDSKWNRLGVGTAKGSNGKVFVVAIFARYQEPVKVTPKPVESTKKPESSNTGSSSGSGSSSNSSSGGSNSGSSSQQSKAEKELAELKAKQKADAEKARKKQEQEAKEREAQAKADAKAKREREVQEKLEAQQKAEAEAKAKQEQEAKNAERLAEVKKLSDEKAQAEADRIQQEADSKAFKATIKNLTHTAGVGGLGLGAVILPISLVFMRKKKLTHVPNDEDWQVFKKQGME